ncbi:TrkH family potassium uptake protein [Capilliphycus salinus ALCB114379]|uniref:TrkH family potassium uptake protein n=1 Tax=Capilliphycus salinus TaxID=2768948 RepID=UPI0039A643F6
MIKAETHTILRNTGLLVHVPGAMALVSLPICLIFQEFYCIVPFLVTAITSGAIGQLLYRLFRKKADTHFREAMLTVALSWGLIPIIGAIPFLLTVYQSGPDISLTVLGFNNPWNAFFEAFSGYTSTGLSMAVFPSQLPHSLQWWRSFMEWIGGVGMIVLILSILEPSMDNYSLYSVEGRNKNLADSVTDTVRWIWKIYLLYTVASIILLRVAGMPWWDAINHGMTGISTGGFSIKDNSIGSYDPIIQIATIPIMIAGAISFYVHSQVIKYRRISALWGDSQHRLFWLFLFLGILVLAWENRQFEGNILILDTLFQWVSALGTCGFNTVKINDWSAAAKLILTLGLFTGAAAGSTVGGLKLSRVVSLGKGIIWRVQRIHNQPDGSLDYEIDNQKLTEEEANHRVQGAAVLAVFWVSLIVLATIILVHFAKPLYSLSDVIFEVTSALGGVGLSTGITDPLLHWAGKLVLILLMWMGRLEVIPVVILLTAVFTWVRVRLEKIF